MDDDDNKECDDDGEERDDDEECDNEGEERNDNIGEERDNDDGEEHDDDSKERNDDDNHGNDGKEWLAPMTMRTCQGWQRQQGGQVNVDNKEDDAPGLVPIKKRRRQG